MKQQKIDYTDRGNYRYLLKEDKVRIQCKALKPYTGAELQRAKSGEYVTRGTEWKDFANERNGLKESYKSEDDARKDLSEFIGFLKSELRKEE